MKALLKLSVVIVSFIATASATNEAATQAEPDRVTSDGGNLRGLKQADLTNNDLSLEKDADNENQNEASIRLLAHDRGQYVSISGKNGRAVNAQMQGNTHVLTFRLADDQSSRIQIRTSPQNQEISIRKIGRDRKNGITDEDRDFLRDLVNMIRPLHSEDQGVASLDTIEVQVERLAGLLVEWPQDLELDYEFDKNKEIERLEERANFEATHPISADILPPISAGGDRHLSSRVIGNMVVTDKEGRRLINYSSLCSQMNTFVAATHDDLWYGRWDDRTTFYALVSNDASCSASPVDPGTWFWTGSAWSCYTPDHDPNIEYAYGNCFGRCGAGCGSGGAGPYTYDCLDHDSCVRFGHSVASPWCNDEFVSSVDDFTFAPDCI